MSREINFREPALSGSSLYAQLHRTGQVRNLLGSDWETPAAALWGSYALSLVEATGTGSFAADLPTGVDLNSPLEVDVYQQAGASPATTDALVGQGTIGRVDLGSYAGVALDASFADLQGELTAVDDSGTVTVLTGKAGVTFPDGVLAGHYLGITSGNGQQQTAIIASNTGAVFTLDRKLPITPAVGDSYQIGGPAEVSPVVLGTTQPNYAPAKAGDAMAISSNERTAIANAWLDLADGIEPGESPRQFLQNLRALCYGLSVPDFPSKGRNTFYRKDGTTVALVYVIGDVAGHRTDVTAFNNS